MVLTNTPAPGSRPAEIHASRNAVADQLAEVTEAFKHIEFLMTSCRDALEGSSLSLRSRFDHEKFARDISDVIDKFKSRYTGSRCFADFTRTEEARNFAALNEIELAHINGLTALRTSLVKLKEIVEAPKSNRRTNNTLAATFRTCADSFEASGQFISDAVSALKPAVPSRYDTKYGIAMAVQLLGIIAAAATIFKMIGTDEQKDQANAPSVGYTLAALIGLMQAINLIRDFWNYRRDFDNTAWKKIDSFAKDYKSSANSIATEFREKALITDITEMKHSHKQPPKAMLIETGTQTDSDTPCKLSVKNDQHHLALIRQVNAGDFVFRHGGRPRRMSLATLPTLNTVYEPAVEVAIDVEPSATD